MRRLTYTVLGVALSGAAAFAAANGATASTTTERFSLISTSTADGPPVFSVVATGAFVDGGTATHDGNGGLELQLSAGTIRLDGIVQQVRVTKTQTATACLQTAAKTISYTIGQGTGAYAGISGSGHARDEDVFVEPLVNGDCSPNPVAVQGTIAADGPISLP